MLLALSSTRHGRRECRTPVSSLLHFAIASAIDMNMPRSTLQVVAAFLIGIQGVFGVAPGRVLCVPTGPCSAPTASTASECSHCAESDCHSAGSPEDASDVSSHDHGLFDMADHPSDGCGSHFHVPLPDDDQAPAACRARGDSPEPRAIVPAVLMISSLSQGLMAWRERGLCTHPPDFSVSAQVLALESTRLLI